jgi:hypothetical protein
VALILTPISPIGAAALRWEWLDPGGVLRDLTHATSPSLFVSAGSAGLGSPPVELVHDKLPFTAGSVLRYTQTQPLEISLPLSVIGSTFAGLQGAVEQVRRWFDTGNERGSLPGYLRVTRPQDGVPRQVACYYSGGLDGDLRPGGPTWAPLVVALLAPDPYWTAIAPSTASYGAAVVGVPQSVINVGDFDAYPVWTITGPASGISINNGTTGKGWTLTANGGLGLAAGEVLTVDTRPASLRSTQQVMVGATNHFNKLAAGSSLWWLAAGSNLFTILASGTSVATAFQLAWLPRYRGVLR